MLVALGTSIEILVQQSLAANMLKEVEPSDNVYLEKCLLLAEPEGYVRVFLDEGNQLVALLRNVHKKAGAFL